MAQPTPYFKATNFTQYATNNPDAPYQPASIDAELNNISRTTVEIANNLAVIQGADGGLNDGVVGVNALADNVLTLIENTNGYKARGAWATNRGYFKNDYFTDSNKLYFAIKVHTSSTIAADLAAGNIMTVGSDFFTLLASQVTFNNAGTLFASNNLQAALIEAQALIEGVNSQIVVQDALIATADAKIAQIDTFATTSITNINAVLLNKVDARDLINFIAYRNAVQAIPNNTQTKIIFDSPQVDNLAGYSAVTGVYTNPNEGSGVDVYLNVSSCVNFANSINGSILVFNGATEIGRATFVASNVFSINFPIAIFGGFDLEVRVIQTSGASQNAQAAFGAKNFFSISRTPY